MSVVRLLVLVRNSPIRRAHELDDATGALEREFIQELRDLEVSSGGGGGRGRQVSSTFF